MSQINVNYKAIEPFSYKPFKSKVAHQIHEKSFLNIFFNKDYIENIYNCYGNLPYYYDTSINEKTSMRSLSYASTSIPDFYNLRMDRSFMENSIEVRQPFLDINLVEYMISLPSYYKFENSNNSKYILREIIDDMVGEKISKRSKYGYANHLWDDEKVRKSLMINEQIGDSNFFSNGLFKKNIKDFLTNDNCYFGIKWSMLALLKTFSQLNKIKEDNRIFLN